MFLKKYYLFVSKNPPKFNTYWFMLMLLFNIFSIETLKYVYLLSY